MSDRGIPSSAIASVLIAAALTAGGCDRSTPSAEADPVAPQGTVEVGPADTGMPAEIPAAEVSSAGSLAAQAGDAESAGAVSALATSAAASDRGSLSSTRRGDPDAPVAASRPEREPLSLSSGKPRPDASAGITPADPETFPVKIEPAILELGAIPVGDQGVGKVKLVNRGDRPVQLDECKKACGCTTLNCPARTTLEPGDEVELDISLQAGRVPAGRMEQVLNKRVTFLFDGSTSLSMQVRGTTMGYVEPEPLYVDPGKVADGAVTLRSRDDQPFRITGITPPLVETADLPAESKAEHVIHLDWARWKELGGERKVYVDIEHPQVQRVTVNIRPTSAADRAKRERLARGDRSDAAKAARVRADAGGGERSGDAEIFKTVERMLRAGRAGQAAEQILDSRIDPSVRSDGGATLLQLAARHGATELIKPLLGAGVDVNGADQRGHTALMAAARYKRPGMVKALIEAGAALDTTDTVGNALSWAVGFGDADSARALIEAGSDLEVRGVRTGYTPLIWAAGFGKDAGALEALVAAGAEVNAADDAQSATPLMHASRMGQARKVHILVDAGADLERRDNRGRTALLLAAASSQAGADTVSALIEAGADVKAVDAEGRGALDLISARTTPDPAVRKLLQQRLNER